MKRKMQEVEVTTSDESIFITQANFGGEDSQIWLSPDQIDVLVKWLIEAKEEVLSSQPASEYGEFPS